MRSSSADPAGDALSSYSLTAPGVAPPTPPAKNEPAADFTSVSVGRGCGDRRAHRDAEAREPLDHVAHAGAHRHGGPVAALDLAVRERLPGLGGERALEPGSPASRSAGTTTPTGGGAVRRCDERQGGEVRRLPGRPAARRRRSIRLTGTITLVIPKISLRQLCAAADADGRPLEAPAASGRTLLRRHGVLVREQRRADAGQPVVPLHARQHAGDGLPPAVGRRRRRSSRAGRLSRPARGRRIDQFVGDALGQSAAPVTLVPCWISVVPGGRLSARSS